MTKNEVEIQELRTKINILKKCINRIEWRANHIKCAPYDYGEAYESAIQDIREIANEYK